MSLDQVFFETMQAFGAVSSGIDAGLSAPFCKVLGVTFTGWKLIGWVGGLMFAGRWFVQAWASKKAGRPTIPRVFWYMSLLGSLMVLLYFTFGKNDSVGIIQNAIPAALAAYNLWLDITSKKRMKEEASDQ